MTTVSTHAVSSFLLAEMGAGTGFIIFVAVGALFAGIIVLAVLHEKKRTEQMMIMAGKMGFMFGGDETGALLQQHGAFALFGRGHGRRITNVLRKAGGRTETAVFDYRYTVSSGKNSSTHSMTVASFRLQGAAFPRFTLEPENFLHKLSEALGFRDIDFPDRPVFSKRYFLKGSDEGAVRSFFSGRVTDMLEGRAGDVCLEAAGDRMVLYSQYKRIAPDALPEFLRQAEEVFGVMAGAGGRA